MDSIWSTLVIQILHGLAYGMLLFLVSSGLTLVFGMMSVLNLAHASFYMLGAYFSYQMLKWIGNFWIGLIICPILVAFLGILMERFLLRRVHAGGHVQEFVLTAGMAFVIMESVKWIWGTEPLPVPIPAALSGSVMIVGSVYPVYRLFILFFSIGILGLMAYVLLKTRLGITVRAAVSDRDMVSALGTNTPFVFMLVMGIGTWLAGVAGSHCRAFHQHISRHGRRDPGRLLRRHRDRRIGQPDGGGFGFVHPRADLLLWNSPDSPFCYRFHLPAHGDCSDHQALRALRREGIRRAS